VDDTVRHYRHSLLNFCYVNSFLPPTYLANYKGLGKDGPFRPAHCSGGSFFLGEPIFLKLSQLIDFFLPFCLVYSPSQQTFLSLSTLPCLLFHTMLAPLIIQFTMSSRLELTRAGYAYLLYSPCRTCSGRASGEELCLYGDRPKRTWSPDLTHYYFSLTARADHHLDSELHQRCY